MDIGGGLAVGRQAPLLDVRNDGAVAFVELPARAAYRQLLDGALDAVGAEVGLIVVVRDEHRVHGRRVDFCDLDAARAHDVAGPLGR